MRHRNGLRKLNRTSSHRQAMFRNMANSLLRHEAIKTTLPRAKELRRVVEPMITLGKKPSLANRRLAFDRLRDRDSVTKLFTVLGPRFKARPGGYTRITKIGPRKGDAAPMAVIELVEELQVAATTGPSKEARKAAAQQAKVEALAPEEEAPKSAAAESADQDSEPPVNASGDKGGEGEQAEGDDDATAKA